MPDRPVFLTDDFIAALDAAGLAVVPKEATDPILAARDEDGDEVWGGGTENYFRNEAEGHWYGRQVWRAMVRAAVDSL